MAPTQLKQFALNVLQEPVSAHQEIAAFNALSHVLLACHFLDQTTVPLVHHPCSFRRPTSMELASRTAFLDVLHQTLPTHHCVVDVAQVLTLPQMDQDATGTVLTIVFNALQIFHVHHV
jgi:hypothetical protein